MPENNLQINITADATKARAELFKLQGDLKEFGRQARQAVAAHDQAATQRAAEGYERTRASISKVTEGLKSVSGAAKETSSTVGELTKKVGELLHASGLGIEGMRALRLGMIALAGVEVVRAVKAAADELNNLNNLANSLRVNPQFLEQMQRASKAVGQNIDVANRMAGAAAKNFNDALLAQKQLGTAFGEGGVIFRGGRGAQPRTVTDLTTVLRGGQVGGDLDAEITKAGGVAPYLLGRPVREKQQAEDLREIARRILAIKDSTYQAALAQRMYNATFEEAFGTKERPGPQRLLAEGTLPAAPAPAETERHQRNLDKYNKDVSDMAEIWTAINRALFDMTIETEQSLKRLFAWQEMLTTPSGGKLPVPSIGEAAPLGAATGSPFAFGGAVRGPGTGTSDSILARLSDGEYVINAASVRRLGTGFLNAINGFALGGLVGPPPIPTFAAGGIVSSASERLAATFHFDSGSAYRLSGPKDVVNAMIGAASQQQMRSAGIKPSWYGG